ncbi:MAG: DUF6519 domain-containing protein [Isosphaeraceae bacterium]
MRGDFSRIRFRPGKHYTTVLQQQGRVSLDADGNEQSAINEYIRDREATDIIGPYGGPIGDEGFQISVDNDAISVGPGRYYVHGILCENAQSLEYTGQPFLINPTLTDSEILEELSSGAASAIQVYLEVWRRLVTALDDPCLREPALGQADTTARVQTVWRVVADPVTVTGTSTPSPPPVTIVDPISTPFPEQFSLLTPQLANLTKANLTTSLKTNPNIISTLVAQAQAAAQAPVKVLTATVGQASATPSADCCAQMYAPSTTQVVRGKLGATTGDGSADCSCQPTPSAGYRGLENQLYRIEIHQGGSEATATFKWSRENGSIVVAVLSVAGANVQVDSLGPDANLGFAAGQWVEITDDSYLFGQPPNQPGDLYQIQLTTPAQLNITMTQPVSQVDITKNARLRRWDQFGSSAGSAGVPLSAGTWLELENGIQVQFTAGQYHSGDAWVIPARTANGQIDWPPCESDGSQFQPGHRTEVFRAPLACIHWNSTSQTPVVEDCRRSFPPLTDLTSDVSSAIHVTQISWTNDDVMTLDQLIADGLTVTLDQAITGDVDGGN